MLGYLEATMELALRNHELREEFKEYIESLVDSDPFRMRE